MSQITILEFQGTPVVDSREVAFGLGIKHQNLIKNIRTHQLALEANFGLLLFQTEVIIGRGQPEMYVLLNEGQCLFTMTLSRNTDRVITCKANLVKAFQDAKHRLASNNTFIEDIQIPPVQEQDIILDTLITSLHILKETKQQLNKVEEITKIHTSALNKVEDITKLHTGALQEVESITKLQADSLEDLESIISDQHSLVVDRLYNLETRLNAQSYQRVTPAPDLFEDYIKEDSTAYAVSSFNYVNNNASILPAPSKELPDIGIETHLNNIVKSYVIKQQCQNNNITFQIAYNLLYKKFLDIFHINIKARCEEHNRHYSPKLTVLKYAVKFDLIQDLYNTAYNLFITGNI